MAIALVPIVVIYFVGAVLALALFVAIVLTRDPWAILGALFITASLAVIAVKHFLDGYALTLRATRARIVDPDDDEHAHLLGLVARVAAAADLPAPRVALIHSSAPNSFATGVSPKRTAIAVTTELLRQLDERELEAVVAHEIAHISNRDGAVMTFVSGPAVLGSTMWKDDEWRAKILFLLYLPIYVVGVLLMWTISRYREYAADRGAALLTGAPEQLMGALQKIGGREPRGDLRGGAAVSALCIVPAQRKGRFSALRRFEVFMDHPPVDKRLRRLEELARSLGKPVAA